MKLTKEEYPKTFTYMDEQGVADFHLTFKDSYPSDEDLVKELKNIDRMISEGKCRPLLFDDVPDHSEEYVELPSIDRTSEDFLKFLNRYFTDG